jgi:predicted Fe-Mo cluster-binding NifX family protein
MKIAFSTAGSQLTDTVDSRFGRAPAFLLYDTDSTQYRILDNSQNVAREQGAGIQAAQSLVEAGANIVIAGHFGPKAAKVLKQAGISSYQCDALSVLDALSAYSRGELRLMVE